MNWREEEATFAQRRTLYNLYTSLGRSTKGIRDMKKGGISDAISKAKEDLNQKRTSLNFNPDGVAAYLTEEQMPSDQFYNS